MPMRQIEALKKEAIESAKFRGHTLSRFRTKRKGSWVISECRRCGRHVTVKTDPLPNEAEIMGEAVAVGCNNLMVP
jgi:hypothetical protein